jgi:hypothetical protein
MVPDFQECAAYGKQFGVILGLQNHNDYLRTAAQTINLIEAVNSDRFGNILDIGSLRSADPYEEIEKLVPYAVSWQLKDWWASAARKCPPICTRSRPRLIRSDIAVFCPLKPSAAAIRAKKCRALSRRFGLFSICNVCVYINRQIS